MKVLISAGPTREPIDPVRFISNRSSGKMGYSLVQSAIEQGDEVTLVSGPVNLIVPHGVKSFIQVQTAEEMFEAITRCAPDMDLIIMTAAVADYTPKTSPNQKIKKEDKSLCIELEPTKDILKYLGEHKRAHQILVGFAAETEQIDRYAQDKLMRKNCDWIAANDVSKKEIGFDSNLNAITLYSRNREPIEIAINTKQLIANQLLMIIKGAI